jgi:hypothetical protein
MLSAAGLAMRLGSTAHEELKEVQKDLERALKAMRMTGTVSPAAYEHLYSASVGLKAIVGDRR